jgi:NAD(P)-dependent dehydrogenase (short-subunit alcohol dehydrogenase family)
MNPRPVALVTGAARGIGRATAVELARRGYDVAMLDVLEAELPSVGAAVAGAGAASLTLGVDLADLPAAQSAIDRVAAEWDRLDLLVNNAAWREIVTMRRITPESWERTLRVSLTAPAFLARRAAALMEPRRRGVIINVSSIVSERAAGTSPAYTAAKAGLDALTYELAALYGRSGIRVVGIRPGAVETAMSTDTRDREGRPATDALRAWSEDAAALGRWATPEEIARAIAMVAGEDASYITGVTIVVDGGLLHGFTPHSLKRAIDPREFP